MARDRDGRDFPVAEMGREAERGLAVVQQFLEQRDGTGADAAVLGTGGIEPGERAEMHVFPGDAAEIVPGFPQGGLDPGGVLVGEGGAEVGLADAVGRQKGADTAGQSAAEGGGAVGVGQPQSREQPLHEAAEDAVPIPRQHVLEAEQA